MADEGRRLREERQRRLRETFLDKANAFVELRMRFLRFTGVQPPDGDDAPLRKKAR